MHDRVGPTGHDLDLVKTLSEPESHGIDRQTHRLPDARKAFCSRVGIQPSGVIWFIDVFNSQ